VKNVKFIRHAESSANAGLPTSDPSDIPLTTAGTAAAVAAAIDYAGPPPDLFIVSPFRRAQETAEPFKKRFPNAAVEEWPVQEFTYLTPSRCLATTSTDRLPLVEAYWKNATSEYVDGPGAESLFSSSSPADFALAGQNLLTFCCRINCVLTHFGAFWCASRDLLFFDGFLTGARFRGESQWLPRMDSNHE
jgi:hypothetical protein